MHTFSILQNLTEKVSKGKRVLPFYSQPEYELWKENNVTTGWKIKYYKVLCTVSLSKNNNNNSSTPRVWVLPHQRKPKSTFATSPDIRRTFYTMGHR